jgi:hypothetical protein
MIERFIACFQVTKSSAYGLTFLKPTSLLEKVPKVPKVKEFCQFIKRWSASDTVTLGTLAHFTVCLVTPTDFYDKLAIY